MFVYLAAVIDWYSRKMMARRVAITMDIDFRGALPFEHPTQALELLRMRIATSLAA
ncbi:hypothetical protein [Luteimonas salinilitoris]|uniref:hypothetical protein n=1 Tax=Luteimonas salinilitoris TaxID=3237697 RepID=UPI00351C1965